MIQQIIDAIKNNSMVFIAILVFILFMIIGFFGDRHFKKKYSDKEKKGTSIIHETPEGDFINKRNTLKKVETNMEPAIEIRLPMESNLKKIDIIKEDKYSNKLSSNEINEEKKSEHSNKSAELNDDWSSFDYDNIELGKSDDNDDERVNNIFWLNII